MDISFITDMYVPIIMVACLVVGFIVKQWIHDVEDKWIPTIVTILGAVLGFVINGATIEAIVAGAVTGLASTGLHQLFKQLIKGGGHDSDGTEE
jgi:hypothetical protein